MKLLYAFLMAIAKMLLPLVALFSKKIQLFYNGRKGLFTKLSKELDEKKPKIWIHVASLGEYEQGVPIIQKMKAYFPNHQLVLSFFSPSGYDVVKDCSVADVVTYMPLDTQSNAKKFVDLVSPQFAIFVKYEFWPLHLSQLEKKNIPTFLISGIFRSNQIFFKSYGGFFRKTLRTIDYFFLQNKASQELLNSIGIQQTKVVGDTRFERVKSIAATSDEVKGIAEFCGESPTIVVGSAWKEDAAIFLPLLEKNPSIKWIIAPHEVKTEAMDFWKSHLKGKVAYYSDGDFSSQHQVLVIDTIGLLSKLYQYGTVAFVGGAFRTGLHNILEPAAFGLPIFFGPKYDKFQEAKDLVANKGAFSIRTTEEFEKQLIPLISNPELQKQVGAINQRYVEENSRVSEEIVQKIRGILEKK